MTLTKPSRFTIDRARWHRGLGYYKSRLVTSEDRMCCLDFYGEACGAPRERMRSIASPAALCDVDQGLKMPLMVRFIEDGHAMSTRLCELLVKTNDDETMSEEDRESVIREQFALHGVEVEFVN